MVVMVLASNSPELATARLCFLCLHGQLGSQGGTSLHRPGDAQHLHLLWIMLAITFAAGFVFGMIRILIRWLFPGKVFDRPENMEVIRLNLDHKE
jgi:hypothetical protein